MLLLRRDHSNVVGEGYHNATRLENDTGFHSFFFPLLINFFTYGFISFSLHHFKNSFYHTIHKTELQTCRLTKQPRHSCAAYLLFTIFSPLSWYMFLTPLMRMRSVLHCQPGDFGVWTNCLPIDFRQKGELREKSECLLKSTKHSWRFWRCD